MSEHPRPHPDLPPPASLPAEPGWSEIEAPASLGAGRSFVSGDPQSHRLRVRYFRRDADGVLVGKAWFGPDAEGPPLHAHGGSMAAVLDEALGTACWMAGYPVLAARLDVSFRKALPLGTVAAFNAVVERVEGRKVFAHAELRGPDGTLFAEAAGLFISLDAARFAQVLGQAMERPSSPVALPKGSR